MSNSKSQNSSILDQNLNQLMQDIPFNFVQKQDYQQNFCHYTHKNLNWRQATFIPQKFTIQLESMYNVKYVVLKNFTHGSEMTISIAEFVNGPYVQVYKDKYICKGKEAKNEQKSIDLGALPCRAIRLEILKGIHINSKNIKLKGIRSDKIQQKLGGEYFKLLVTNPQRIMFN